MDYNRGAFIRIYFSTFFSTINIPLFILFETPVVFCLILPVLIYIYFSYSNQILIFAIVSYITIIYNHVINKTIPLFITQNPFNEEKFFIFLCLILDFIAIAIVLFLNYALILMVHSMTNNFITYYFGVFYVISIFDFLKSAFVNNE